MTEQEWWECNYPEPMLSFLQGKVSDRKLRLFACACCRRLPLSHFSEDRDKHVFFVRVAEQLAEGQADVAELHLAEERRGVYDWSVLQRDARIAAREASDLGISAAIGHAWSENYEKTASAFEKRNLDVLPDFDAPSCKLAKQSEANYQAALLRDLFGYPFASISLAASWLLWNGGTIPRLAQAIYDDRALPSGHLDHVRLAILADALEEAGCTEVDLLAHLRRPEPHVRGCWAVDLLLGKS